MSGDLRKFSVIVVPLLFFLAFSSKYIFTRLKLSTHAHVADFRESIYLTSLNRVRIIIIILRDIHNIMIIHNLCVYLLRAARKNIIGIVKSQKELYSTRVLRHRLYEWGRVL